MSEEPYPYGVPLPIDESTVTQQPHQNDQGWPPYQPPQQPPQRSLAEITVEEAHYVTNMLLDCQGLELIRYIDNRVAAHINRWEAGLTDKLRRQWRQRS
jgi:hypothetical protein